jgi:predicted permease
MALGFSEFRAAARADLIVETGDVLTTWVSLPSQRYANSADRLELYRRLEEQLGTISGVSSVAVAGALPHSGAVAQSLVIDGRAPVSSEPLPTVSTVAVSTRYFGTLNLQLLQGRAFTDGDGRSGQETVIVNQRLATMYFGAQSALGQRIRLGSPTSAGTATALSIIGVAPNVRQQAVGAIPDPVAYLPLTATPPPTAALIVRAAAAPDALTAVLRDEIRRIDPDLPVYRTRTMDQVVNDSRWNARISQELITAIAAIGLLLSAVGLYAVTTFAVAQRTREIGVRIALGAQRAQVLWLVLRRVVFQLALGLGVGVICVIGWDRQLPDDPTVNVHHLTDPMVLAPVATLLAIVTLAAAAVPARRATRLDPVAALRIE